MTSHQSRITSYQLPNIARFIATAGAILLLALAVVAGKWGVADIYRVAGRHYLTEWSENRTVSDVEDWERAHNLLAVAHKLHRANPNILNDLGRLHEWKVRDSRFGDKEASPHLRQALQYYRDAVAMRPAWPYTWSNLATAKLKLGEIDHEFLVALTKAIELGPWERPTQFATVEAGLTAWPFLPDETREIVMTAIDRALRVQGPEIVELALSKRREHLLYPLIKGNERLEVLLPQPRP